MTGCGWIRISGFGSGDRERQLISGDEVLIAGCAKEHGLDPELILSVALPSVRLVTGATDLPIVGRVMCESDGPLSLVAALDLAALAEIYTTLGNAGELQVFYDDENQPWGAHEGGWEVRQVAAGTAQGGHPVGGFAELTIPFPRTMEARGLGVSLEQYYDVYAAWTQRRSEPIVDGKVHRFLGHADAIQGDLKRRIEGDLQDVEDLDEPPAGFDHAAAGWSHLLQLDSDRDFGMSWGGFGRIYLFKNGDRYAGQLQT